MIAKSIEFFENTVILWRLEVGRWKMEDGSWETEDGRWKPLFLGLRSSDFGLPVSHKQNGVCVTLPVVIG